MIPRQLSPSDNPQFAIFSSGFRLCYNCLSCSALHMNADNKQTASGHAQKTGISESVRASVAKTSKLTDSIKAELLQTPKFDPSISCKLIPEFPFPWNGAFLEWQKELRNHTKVVETFCTRILGSNNDLKKQTLPNQHHPLESDTSAPTNQRGARHHKILSPS